MEKTRDIAEGPCVSSTTDSSHHNSSFRL